MEKFVGRSGGLVTSLSSCAVTVIAANRVANAGYDMDGKRPKKRAVKGDTYYGKIAENYEQRRTKQDWWWKEHEMMAACLGSLPHNQSLLDVPFGTGRFLSIYKALGHKVHGLDASGEMIAQARKLRESEFEGVETTVGSAMALPFEDKSFDVLISVRFLSEIITFADATVALQEFVRVTRSTVVVELTDRTAGEGRVPGPEEAMRDLMDAGQVDSWLGENGLDPVKRFAVREQPKLGSTMNLIMCHVR